MKNRIFAAVAALALAACTQSAPTPVGDARKVDHITCALRQCQLMAGGEFMAVALKGIEQPDLPGRCTAEGMMYVSAFVFMKELVEKAERIEVSEIGKEVIIHSGAFNHDYLLKEAKITVDGKDLAQLLADKGLALRIQDVTKKMRETPEGVWCGGGHLEKLGGEVRCCCKRSANSIKEES